MHMTTKDYGEDCTWCATFRNINTSETLKHKLKVKQSNVIAEVECMNKFYENNVRVTTNNSCDVCGETKYFIPNMNLTG